MAKIIKIIGYILIFLGLSIPVGYETKNDYTSYMEEVKITTKEKENNYYALLEIPKISLKKEIFPKNSKENNVNKNLELHKESIMPENDISNVIILGHSGNGTHAYFKELYLLEYNDKIKLYYNNTIYYYEITYIEEEPKTGELSLTRVGEHMLTLITCTKNNKNTQTIYYATLKNKENISKN